MVLFTNRQPVSVRRRRSDRMSNGDRNPVHLDVTNNYPFPVTLRIIDELPDQLQERKFSLAVSLKGGRKAVPWTTNCGQKNGANIFFTTSTSL